MMAGATQVATGTVRFSYCNVFKPRTSLDGGADKYSVTLLIPKTDTATVNKIRAAIEAAKSKYAEKTGKKAAGLKSTLHDGDGERPNGEEFSPECKGCYVITVSSFNKPAIVDKNRLPITDPQELYSGCYGRAVINFYAYDRNGNKGVTAGLNGIMKLRGGEPLGGGIVTDSDWDNPDDDSWDAEDDDLPF